MKPLLIVQIILAVVFFLSLLVVGFPDPFQNKYAFISYVMLAIPIIVLIIPRATARHRNLGIAAIILLDAILLQQRLS